MNNTSIHKKVLYLGFNNMLKHKRGVENVIDFQSKAIPGQINYYMHWDDNTSVYKYKNFICVGIKSSFLKYLVFNWFMLRIKRREQKIFIHSHNALMSMTCIFKTNLFTVHDALYYQNRVTQHKLKGLFYFLEKFLYTRVGFVHFISQFSKQKSLISKNKRFKIIYNTSFLESLKKVENVDDQIEFNVQKTKIFVVRSMEERSRIDLVLNLAEHLKNKNFEIFIAGKGPLLRTYQSAIEKLKLENINFLGYVNDAQLMHYYNTCDVVLMTAEYAEGFGLPIIEGYLFNKPVIASNKCAIPEVIISADFLFDNTAENVIQKLDYALSRPDKPYKDYYDKNFSNAYIINEFNLLYKSLM